MVEAITLERAIAEGATSGQMLAIAEWHEERIDALNSGKKPKNYDQRLSHHSYFARAMHKLAKALAGVELEAAA